MTEQQKYWLARHVYLCVTDNYAVLLDLRRDKYIGIAREHMSALAASVVGWPRMAQSNNVANNAANTASPQSADTLLTQMVLTGMLTVDPATGKDAQPLSMPSQPALAIQADLEHRPRITALNLWQVLAAAATAKALLRWRPIETIVTRVKQRKEQRCTATEFDFDAARPLVEAFVYLRPLFFTTKDECLFDSLVLVELLARHDLFPVWLFGVSTNPFKAHSWVRAGDHILNDQPERIARFTPILAI